MTKVCTDNNIKQWAAWKTHLLCLLAIRLNFAINHDQNSKQKHIVLNVFKIETEPVRTEAQKWNETIVII